MEIAHKGEIIDNKTGLVIRPIIESGKPPDYALISKATTPPKRPTLKRISNHHYLLTGKKNTTHITTSDYNLFRHPPANLSKRQKVRRQKLAILLFLNAHPKGNFSTADISKVMKLKRTQAYSRLQAIFKQGLINKVKLIGSKRKDNGIYYTTNPLENDRNLNGNYIWYVRKNAKRWFKA